MNARVNYGRWSVPSYATQKEKRKNFDIASLVRGPIARFLLFCAFEHAHVHTHTYLRAVIWWSHTQKTTPKWWKVKIKARSTCMKWVNFQSTFVITYLLYRFNRMNMANWRSCANARRWRAHGKRAGWRETFLVSQRAQVELNLSAALAGIEVNGKRSTWIQNDFREWFMIFTRKLFVRSAHRYIIAHQHSRTSNKRHYPYKCKRGNNI